MPTFDCLEGESLWLGSDVRVKITGLLGDTVYFYIDAAARCEMSEVSGFHASAPFGLLRYDHIVILPVGGDFTIDETRITVEAACREIARVRTLRPVRLRIDAPVSLAITREAPLRPKRLEFARILQRTREKAKPC